MFRVTRPRDGVSVLTMDDGKVNAIGPDFVEQWPAAWKEATADDAAVVLAGNAKAFGAGLDLKRLPQLDRDGLVAFMRGFVRMLHAGYSHRRPVVAAVDGPALAGGAFLAFMGDVRLVSERARMGLTEMPVGIPFPAPVLDLARRELPPHELGPAVLQGVIREGAACVERGWAHERVPRDGLLEEAVARAAELADFNPRAYAAAKEGLRGFLARDVEAFEKSGVEAYVDELASEETMRAVVRYFERVTRK